MYLRNRFLTFLTVIILQVFSHPIVSADNQGPKLFLIEAVLERNLEVLRWLVKQEANVNVKDEYGLTPLMHVLTLDENVEMIQVLLELGADTDLRDNEGKTALHLAAETGKKEAVELLIGKMKNSSITDNNGRTALHLAVNSNDEQILSYLINKGMDCSAKDVYGFTAIHAAAMLGKTQMLTVFNDNGIDLNLGITNGTSPLILASLFDQNEAAEFLIKLGSNVDSLDNNNWTALHSAAYTGNLKLVQLLVENNATLDIINSDGRTPLYLAVNNSEYAIAEYLTDKGSNISVTDNYRNTLLHGAAASGNVKLLQYLTERLNALDEYNELGYTPIIEAALKGNMDAIEFLKNAGADTGIVKRLGAAFLQKAVSTNNTNLLKSIKKIDDSFIYSKRDSQGATLLHYASRSSNADTVKYLIDAMAEEQFKVMGSTIKTNRSVLMGPELCLPCYVNITNIKDYENKTSLYYVAEWGNSDVVDILLNLGTDQSYADDNGLTALHVAAKHGHEDVLKKLVPHNLNLNLVDKKEKSSIFLSAEEGKLNSLKYLVSEGADMTIKDSRGWSLLHAATANGHMVIVQELLRHAETLSEINAVDKDDKPPTWYAINNAHLDILEVLELNGGQIKQDHLCEAVQQNNVEFVKYLTNKNGEQVVMDCFNKGTTLLHIAATKGHVTLLKQLTKYSCLVKSLDKENKSPLWYAVHELKWDCVTELEEAGGEIKPHVTPEHAIRNNLVSFVKYFVKKGVNVNSDSLHIAASKGYTDVVKELVKYRRLINAIDVYSKSPLWYAIQGEKWGCVDVIEKEGGVVRPYYNIETAANNNLLSYVKYLIRKGVSVDSLAGDGIPVVYWSAIDGYTDIVEYFLDSGADIEALNPNTRNSMVIIASYYGKCDTVRLLLQKGAYVNRINKSGHTALDVTRPACRELLLSYGARTSWSLRG